MCGIYGIIGKSYRKIEPIFSKYLRHRGPDDKGIFYDDKKKLALGHTRLSIIDLSSNAHQPMVDESGNYVLVFNGEIYNYKDLRKELEKLGYKFKTDSDTEVLLKAYIEWKEKCLEKFRGMFAFCIYDKIQNILFLARDRFGIKPLIYGFINNQFIFTSELKPILKSSIFPKKLNYKAIESYFRYGSVKQPDTILEDFYFLMPSHFMVVDVNTLNKKIVKYYDLVEKALKLPKIENYNEAIKITRNYLEDATRYHLVADVEIGAFLSGGVDSTAVVALMKKYTTKKINTFSIGFKDKTEVVDETDVANRSAKYLGTNHHNIKIDGTYVLKIFDDFIESIDQPTIDGINTFIVSLETAKKVKVALSGLGGDEIFAGYSHFETIRKYAKQKRGLISIIGEKLNAIRPNRFTNKYKFIGLEEEMAVDKQRTINNDLNKILKLQKKVIIQNEIPMYKKLSSIQKISKYEIDNYMLNTLLRDTDVVSMAHSLEVRPVLLDHKLVEFIFSLPDSFKIRNGRHKSILIDSVKDIIPKEVWQRKKTGFEMPFVNWMNGALNSKFKEVVENKKADIIFNDRFLKLLRKRVKNRKLKRNDWMYFIFLSWLDRMEIEI